MITASQFARQYASTWAVLTPMSEEFVRHVNGIWCEGACETRTVPGQSAAGRSRVFRMRRECRARCEPDLPTHRSGGCATYKTNGDSIAGRRGRFVVPTWLPP